MASVPLKIGDNCVNTRKLISIRSLSLLRDVAERTFGFIIGLLRYWDKHVSIERRSKRYLFLKMFIDLFV